MKQLSVQHFIRFFCVVVVVVVASSAGGLCILYANLNGKAEHEMVEWKGKRV